MYDLTISKAYALTTYVMFKVHPFLELLRHFVRSSDENFVDYGWGVEDLDEDNDEDEIEDDDGWGVTSASPLSAGKTKTAEAKPVQQKV